ncbi:MAG: carbon-nitrogen hydrolase family protein, partial [Epsilonproteobacteria bacterium]|nr:carbon-nitrogen hydrolase family protein [Campylobacterota bacterium]NPA64989.1 carbon-nitrogen hydrolase family protein [Campylobacterota bacterium]
NFAKVLYQEKLIYEQPKVRLFKFGGETDYFSSGSLEDIRLFEVNGLKVGLLICFELRFIEIWERLRGADIILVPAMWGKLRKRHFEQFTEALALMHQCFLIASDSANDDMAKSSAIIDPFGVPYRDDRRVLLNKEVDLGDIKKMRRYMDIGL